MNTKLDTTTRIEVVDKLEKLKDVIDRHGAAQIDDESVSDRAADRIEMCVIRDMERIDYVIGLLEAFETEIWTD